MPSTQSKRDLILKSSVAAGTVADLTISMDASFDTSLTTTITYEDESGSPREEKTKYKMVFANASGATLGTITLKLVGDPQPATGDVTVTKPVARYTFDPSGRETTVALLPSPNASFERVWKQNVTDSTRAEVVDDVAKLDIRVSGENGAVVSQSAKSQENNELVVNYEWSTAATGVVVSGSVTLTTTAVAGSGYTLGNIRVTDTDSTAGTTRRR